MAKTKRESHPLLFVALFGALLTFIGAIISWVEWGKDAGKSSSPAPHIFIFIVALGAMVPLFSVLGHLRRAHQLYAIAFVLAVASMVNLVESTNSYVFLGKNESVRKLYHIPTRLAGLILQMIGILLSLAPAVKGARASGLPLGVTGFAALLWFVAGIMYATKAKHIYTQPIFDGGYSTASTTIAFLFGSWALLAGLTRSTSLSVGLGVAAVNQWTFFVLEILRAIPPQSHSSQREPVIGAADALSISATVVFLLWIAYDFCREKVHDRIKHGHDGYLSLN